MSNEAGLLYTWKKDKHFRYIECNENYAMAAGLDSPHSIVGKNDDQMPWRSLAGHFRRGDQMLMGGHIGRVNIQEKEIMVDRTADILVTENQLLNSYGHCIGVTGYFIDITGLILVKKNGYYDNDKKRFYLGKEFKNRKGDPESLTGPEYEILKKIMMGRTALKIAKEFLRSQRTIESQINSIKRKLGCDSKGDIIATAISAGLQWILYGCEFPDDMQHIG